MKAIRFLILMLVLQNALAAFSQQYWKVSGYTESIAKSYLDSNSSSLDPIEGIWQSTEGSKYAVEKDVENGRRQNGKYRVVVLEHFSRWWSTGEIQAFISDGSSESLYSMKYYSKYDNNGAAAGAENYFIYREGFNIASYTRTINDYGTLSKINSSLKI